MFSFAAEGGEHGLAKRQEEEGFLQLKLLQRWLRVPLALLTANSSLRQSQMLRNHKKNRPSSGY